MVNDPTMTNVNFMLWTNQCYNPYSIATFCFGAGTRMHKSLSLRWFYSCQLFQQLCAIGGQCSSSRSRESQIQCWCRGYEVACRQLVWLSNSGSQSLFSYRCLNDEDTHAAINNKMFLVLGQINDQIYEVELADSEVQIKEPLIVGILFVQCAKLRMLELYYNSLYKTFQYWQVWGEGNWCRLTVYSTGRKRIVWWYTK